MPIPQRIPGIPQAARITGAPGPILRTAVTADQAAVLIQVPITEVRITAVPAATAATMVPAAARITTITAAIPATIPIRSGAASSRATVRMEATIIKAAVTMARTAVTMVKAAAIMAKTVLITARVAAIAIPTATPAMVVLQPARPVRTNRADAVRKTDRREPVPEVDANGAYLSPWRLFLA